ncbi:MAG: hypothetical protein ACOCXJ_08415 [Planctomycetota bacterium]
MTIATWSQLAQHYDELQRRLQAMAPDADLTELVQQVELLGTALRALPAPRPDQAAEQLAVARRVQEARAACVVIIAERRRHLISEQRLARNTAQALKAYGQRTPMAGRYHDRRH